MNDETKNQFDAPWYVFSDGEACFAIYNKSDDFVCGDILMFDDAKRIAYLPELYDALNKQAYYRCVDCLRHTANTIDDIPLNKDMIEHGCPKNRTDCGALDAWKLLKKVRNGE